MNSARPGGHAADQQPQPELTRLETPGGRGPVSWRLAAGFLAVFLIGVILAGRLGMDELPGADPSPGNSPIAAATPRPSPAATPAPSRPPSAEPSSRPTLAPSFDPPLDFARYPDGLPTSIAGERVHRLEAALSRAGVRDVLVGGWYVGPECLWPGRCTRQLADSPGTPAFGGRTVALAGLEQARRGPYVLRVRRNDDCAAALGSEDCYPVFDVLSVEWQGDLYTRAGPVEAGPLLGALKFAFPDMRAEPFRDLARCPVEWPPQTYRSTTGGPRMTIVFPTLEDRLALERAVRTNWPQPASYPGAQCLDQFMDQGHPAGWIAEENVMVWVQQDPAQVALARAAIFDARSKSQPDAVPVQRPISTWAALRTLAKFEPDLELLSPHDVLVWGPQLGTGPPEPGMPEAYALSDPLVRALLVFPSSAERRAYGRAVEADDVILIFSVSTTLEGVAAGLIETRAVGVRWLAYRNLLLQVTGPPGFDQDLRRHLRSELD